MFLTHLEAFFSAVFANITTQSVVYLLISLNNEIIAEHGHKASSISISCAEKSKWSLQFKILEWFHKQSVLIANAYLHRLKVKTKHQKLLLKEKIFNLDLKQYWIGINLSITTKININYDFLIHSFIHAEYKRIQMPRALRINTEVLAHVVIWICNWLLTLDNLLDTANKTS